MTVPPGFTALAAGTRRALLRDDLVPALGAWLLHAPFAPPPGAEPLGGGRGAAFRLDLGDGRSAVVRFGRRGGLVARLVLDRYLGARPRPWRELALSLVARDHGAPVPEVIAAAVHGWGAYRSAVVTGELTGVRPVLAALRAAEPGEARAAVARAAADAVARLHRAGVVHPDLNLGNIVVDATRGAIVDLDRARLVPGGLSARLRERGLRRLDRSARKLDPAGEVVDAAVRRTFHDAYARALEQTCAS